MLNRRNFIKGAGMAALGSMALPKMASAFLAPQHTLGVQLFTFFGTIDKDVPGTLKKISAIGYREIESAYSLKPGYYGETPKGFAALCKSEGLSWRSHHVLGAPFKMPEGKSLNGPDGKPLTFPPVKNLRENAQQIVDEAAEGGIPYLVCATTPVATIDEIKASIEVLHKAGELCKKAGLQLCYHNHDMEFVMKDGQLPYQMLLDGVPADLLKMELDLAWVTKAGVDPVEMFKKHPGRFPLLHIKDISADFKTLQPAGTGVVDFKRIFANASIGGARHFFIEHDMPKDAFESIQTSYTNLRKMGI